MNKTKDVDKYIRATFYGMYGSLCGFDLLLCPVILLRLLELHWER